MSQPKELLLISYTFPPAPGIGGRRWAKFAKYLVKAGYSLHVVTTPFDTAGKTSTWAEEVNHPNITRYEVPGGYPELKPSNNILGKIRNKLTVWRLMASTQGTIYDKSIFWHAKVLNQVKSILQDRPSIQTLIVTGAPFHLFYQIGKIKEAYPELQLWLDYRDPWTNGVVYGMEELSDRRRAYEVNMEIEALKKADVVSGPTDPHLMVGPPIAQSKTTARIVELQHAFDPDDLPKVVDQRRASNQIRLVYGGTIYLGVEKHLERLKLALDELRVHRPDFYQKLRIEVYTPEVRYQSLFGDHGETVSFSPPISATEIFQKVAEADICLLFLSYHNKHYRTTKFFEFLTLSKPFLLIGQKGKAAEYIEQEQLGLALDQEEITARNLEQAIRSLLDQDHTKNEQTLYPFSFEARTQELIQLLPKPTQASNSFSHHG